MVSLPSPEKKTASLPSEKIGRLFQSPNKRKGSSLPTHFFSGAEVAVSFRELYPLNCHCSVQEVRFFRNDPIEFAGSKSGIANNLDS